MQWSINCHCWPLHNGGAALSLRRRCSKMLSKERVSMPQPSCSYHGYQLRLRLSSALGHGGTICSNRVAIDGFGERANQMVEPMSRAGGLCRQIAGIVGIDRRLDRQASGDLNPRSSQAVELGSFHLARSGRFTTLTEVPTTLDREGYSASQIQGPLLKRQLTGLIKAARRELLDRDLSRDVRGN